MNLDARKLVMFNDPLDDIARAIIVDFATPTVSVVFEGAEGGIDSRSLRPYSLERLRDGLGRFVVKGETIFENSDDVEEITILIDPLAEDGSAGRVELSPRTTPAY